MQNTASTKDLEKEVKKLAEPFNAFIKSLQPEVRPARQSPFSWSDDWDDKFGQWADDTPPPWQGEDRLK